MSLILDALRRGRGKQTPQLNSNAAQAQTDALLHTLGYGPFNKTSPSNRFKRIVAYLALTVLFAIVLWGAVIWITLTYFGSAAIDESTLVLQEQPRAAPDPMPAPPRGAAQSELAPPITTTPSVTTARPVTTEPSVTMAPPPRTTPPVTTARPASARSGASASAETTSVDGPTAPPARSAGRAAVPVAPNVPVAPVTSTVIVQPSQRISIPDSAPTAPTGAPSRTAVSTAAGANMPTVTTGDDHFTRGMMYQRLGDFENALVSYRQVLQRDDLNVEAHNNLGVLYRDKGLFDDATSHFQRAIAINPAYARARNNLGVVYLTQRRLDMAAAQFHAALAIDPKNVESMVNLSTTEKELGRRDAARAWLMRALQADTRNAEAHYNLGLLEDEAGDRTKALVHYRAFLQYGAAIHPTLVGEVRKRISDLESKN